MKILDLNLNEIKPGWEEQILIVAFGNKSDFENMGYFFKETNASNKFQKYNLEAWQINEMKQKREELLNTNVLNALKEFANITVEPNSVDVVLVDEGDEQDILIDKNGEDLRCFWGCSA